jgi:ELWxxDGT repeat protein
LGGQPGAKQGCITQAAESSLRSFLKESQRHVFIVFARILKPASLFQGCPKECFMSLSSFYRFLSLTLAVHSFVLLGCDQDGDAPADDTLPAVRAMIDATPTPPSDPYDFVVAGETLFFIAETNDAGDELWKSDGSKTGTNLVMDINPGPAGSEVSDLTAVGNQVYFVAYTPAGGYQLWKSDGSETGTQQLTSLQTGVWGGQCCGDLGVLNGEIYFQGDDGTNGSELWKSDGTLGGATLVMDIFPGFEGSNPIAFGTMGDQLFFSAADGEHGVELWVSQGTAATTHIVKDIIPGEGSSLNLGMVVAGNQVFFHAEDGVHGYELWVSDGTEQGTRMVKDIGPGEVEAYLSWMVPMGSTLFFHADDGKNGLELWKSDGTEKGTVMVKNIHEGDLSSEPRGLVVAGNQLYFFADYGPAVGLFRSNGTHAGTSLIRGNLALGYNFWAPPFITAVGTAVYFNVYTERTGSELWNASKRTAWSSKVIAAQVKDIYPGVTDSNMGEMVAFKGKLYFNADDGVHGNELWMSNGTSTGTILVKDINP